MLSSVRCVIVGGMMLAMWFVLPRLIAKRERSHGPLTAHQIALLAAGRPALLVLMVFYGVIIFEPSGKWLEVWWFGLALAAGFLIKGYPIAYFFHKYFIERTRDAAAQWKETHGS